MEWYNPISWFRKAYSKVEEKSQASEREQRKAKLEEALSEKRMLLEYVAVMRCLPVEMAKQRVHERYRCFADLKQ